MEQDDFSDVDELHRHQQSEPLGPRRYSKQLLSTRIDSVNLALLLHLHRHASIASRDTTHSYLQVCDLTFFSLDHWKHSTTVMVHS